MFTEDDTKLQEEIQRHLDYLVNHLGARPVGSAENARTRAYLTEYIHKLGFSSYPQETSMQFRRPTSWSCTIHSHGVTESLSILPGLATLKAQHSNIPVTPRIYETKEDFDLFPPVQNSLVLVSLGRLHEADACRLAGSAAAVAWFRKGQQCLYSGNCMRNQEEPLVPGFGMLYQDVQRVLAPEIFLSLTIEVVNEITTISNLIVDVGDVTGHPCFITHYDSRPFSPGANDNASGVVCLLGMLSLWSDDRPARFIFFDAEEVGTLGSRAYVQWLQSTQKMSEISCIVNPDSVGLGELYLYTGDRNGPLSEKLLGCARQAFGAYNWKLPERAARSGQSDYLNFNKVGVPCLFLSDFPNDIRHTTEDSLVNINPSVLVRLSKVLAQESFYKSIS
jgi:aminopeptidase YwaD